MTFSRDVELYNNLNLTTQTLSKQYPKLNTKFLTTNNDKIVIKYLLLTFSYCTGIRDEKSNNFKFDI